PVRPSFASPEIWYMASLPQDAHLAMLLPPTGAFPSGTRGQTALVQYGTENDYSHETTGKRAGSLTPCHATSRDESSARRQKYVCRRASQLFLAHASIAHCVAVLAQLLLVVASALVHVKRGPGVYPTEPGVQGSASLVPTPLPLH